MYLRRKISAQQTFRTQRRRREGRREGGKEGRTGQDRTGQDRTEKAEVKMSSMGCISAAVVQLLESSTDEEELVRTSALASLQSIAKGTDGKFACNTMRATIAYLKANEGDAESNSSGAGNANAKKISKKTRALIHVHILRAVQAVAEAGHLRFDAELAQEITRTALNELKASNEQAPIKELTAARILVTLSASHMDIVVDELLGCMKAGAIPDISLMYSLEQIALTWPNDFVPSLGKILSRVVPMLGAIAAWKLQVQVAVAFTAFGEALSQKETSSASPEEIPSDVRASMQSSFDIFHASWLSSSKDVVQSAAARALGALAPFVHSETLANSMPSISSKIIETLARISPDAESREGLAKGLHGILLSTVNIASSEEISGVLSNLQPLVSLPADYARPNFNRTRSEILRVIEVLTAAHARIVVEHFCNCLSASVSGGKASSVQAGLAAVLTHIINHCQAHVNKASIREIITSGILRVCTTNDLDVRASLAQLIVAMGNAGFLGIGNTAANRDSGGRELILFVVEQCVFSNTEMQKWHASQGKGWFSSGSSNSVSPLQLSRAGERFVDALGQCAPGIVWKTLFTTFTQKKYRGAVAAVCMCLINIAKSCATAGQDAPSLQFDSDPDLPSSAELFSRLLILCCYCDVDDYCPHVEKTSNTASLIRSAENACKLLLHIGPSIHPAVRSFLSSEALRADTATTDRIDGNTKTDVSHSQLNNLLNIFIKKSSSIVAHDAMWWTRVGDAVSDSLSRGDYEDSPALKASAYRILGIVISHTQSSDLPRKWIKVMLDSVSHKNDEQRYGLARAFELAATSGTHNNQRNSTHLDLILQALAKILRDECSVIKQGWFGSSQGDRSEVDVAFTKGTLLLCWGHVCNGAQRDALRQHLDAQIITNVMNILSDINEKKGGEPVAIMRDCFLHAITYIGYALDARKVESSRRSTKAITFASRDAVLGHLCRWLNKSKSENVRARCLRAISALCSIAPPLSEQLQEHVFETALSTLSITSTAKVSTPAHQKILVKEISNISTILLRMRGRENMAVQLECLMFASAKNVKRPVHIGKLETHICGEDPNQRVQALQIVSQLLCDYMCKDLMSCEVNENMGPPIENALFIQLFCTVMPRLLDTDDKVKTASLGLLKQVVEIGRGAEAVNKMFESKVPTSDTNVLRLLHGSSAQERCTAVCMLIESFLKEVTFSSSSGNDLDDDINLSINVETCLQSLLPSLNDIDSGAAQAGAEALISLVAMFGSRCSNMVAYLFSTPASEDDNHATFDKKGSAGAQKRESEQSLNKDQQQSEEDSSLSPILAALQRMQDRTHARRMARTTVLFACRSLFNAHFEDSMDALLASPLPLDGVVLDIIVVLVAPPATMRPLDSKQLPQCATQPLLQKVVEHLLMTLKSAPPGTAEAPNGVLSAAHQALAAILKAPSALVTSFVNRYFVNLVSAITVSICSLSRALEMKSSDDNDSGSNIYLRDAFASQDALLRRLGCSDICTYLHGPDVYGVRSSTDGEFSRALAKIVSKICGVTSESKMKTMKIMEQYVSSGDSGQREVSLAIMVELVCIQPKTFDGSVLKVQKSHYESIFDTFLGRAMDRNARVQSEAIRGLGILTRECGADVFEIKAAAVLTCVSGLLDAKNPIIADMALKSLESILSTSRLGLVEHILLNVCFRLQATLEVKTASTICGGLKLLQRIAALGLENAEEKNDLAMQLVEQMHRMLPLVLVQIRSESFEVSGVECAFLHCQIFLSNLPLCILMRTHSHDYFSHFPRFALQLLLALKRWLLSLTAKAAKRLTQGFKM